MRYASRGWPVAVESYLGARPKGLVWETCRRSIALGTLGVKAVHADVANSTLATTTALRAICGNRFFPAALRVFLSCLYVVLVPKQGV